MTDLEKAARLLAEVKSDVEEITGVKIDLKKVNLVIAGNVFKLHQEHCIRRLCENGGLDYAEVSDALRKTKFAKVKAAFEKVFGLLIGGLYSQNAHTIILPRGKVRSMQDDALKTVIAHELVHYAQDLAAPEVFNTISYEAINTLAKCAGIKFVFSHQKCPRCGAAMILRHGKYGRFWGCSKVPRDRVPRKLRLLVQDREGCQRGNSREGGIPDRE